MSNLLGKIIITKTIKYAAYFFIGIIVSFVFIITYGLIIGVETMPSGPVARKPAIYLYPEVPTQINVDLFIKGEIIVSEPLYNNGWEVKAYPNGTIESSEGKHDYLFYEANLDSLDLPHDGWCVDYDSLEIWMTETLENLGLNEKESAEFKEYWLETLPYKPYYEIKLLSQEYVNEYMELDIIPIPNTVIRVHLYFKGIIDYENIKNPIISEPVNNGFTVVEWGGILE